MTSCTTPRSSIVDHYAETAGTIASLHRDIIEEHILGRLDGQSLASLRCTSSYFNALSSQEELWRKVCISSWPSINHPRIDQLISAAPGGHRRFFSDCSPLLTPHHQLKSPNITVLCSELLSAVDIWFQNEPILSRVTFTDTKPWWFLHDPFRVDILDPKESLPTLIKSPYSDLEEWQKALNEELIVNWIILDPSTKKGAKFSTLRPMSTEIFHRTGEITVEYATIVGDEAAGYMECEVVVKVGGFEEEDGELHVKEVCMQMKDMDGKYLNGKDSLVILVNAINYGMRFRGDLVKGRKIHEMHLKGKRFKYVRKVSRGWTLEIACSGVGDIFFAGICIFGYLVVKLTKYFNYFSR